MARHLGSGLCTIVRVLVGARHARVDRIAPARRVDDDELRLRSRARIPTAGRRRAPCADRAGTSPAVRWPVREGRRSSPRRAWTVARRGERLSSRHPPAVSHPDRDGGRRQARGDERRLQRRRGGRPRLFHRGREVRLEQRLAAADRGSDGVSAITRLDEVGDRRVRLRARSIASRPRRGPGGVDDHWRRDRLADVLGRRRGRRASGCVGRTGTGAPAPVAVRREARDDLGDVVCASAAWSSPSRPHTSANPRRASSAAQRWSRRDTATTSPFAAVVAVGVAFVVRATSRAP